MLGYVMTPTDEAGGGAAARLLSRTAASLAAEGIRLAGAVQRNHDRPDGLCDMELVILGEDGAGAEAGPAIRISQDLGRCAQGCRLDGDALARAVGRAGAVLDRGADLLIVNKFGKQEAMGGGFRDLIGQALARGVPVLLAVAPAQQAQFLAFAEDLARPVAAADAAGWGRRMVASLRAGAAE